MNFVKEADLFKKLKLLADKVKADTFDSSVEAEIKKSIKSGETKEKIVVNLERQIGFLKNHKDGKKCKDLDCGKVISAYEKALGFAKKVKVEKIKDKKD